MKKWILFLLFILILQSGYKIIPVLAQEDKGAIIIEAKKVIEKFLRDFDYRDISSMMQWVSVNYADTIDNIIINYDKFKSMTEDRMVGLSKKYTGYVSSNVEILKSDVQGNIIILEIEFTWRGFNLDTLEDESGKLRRRVTLAKENDLWKITRWKWLKQSE
jgi:hypothetical protein